MRSGLYITFIDVEINVISLRSKWQLSIA